MGKGKTFFAAYFSDLFSRFIFVLSYSFLKNGKAGLISGLLD